VRRLPALAFAALVLATVGAFFVTQHLKVSTPLIAGAPAPVPAVVDPYGPACPVHLAHGRVLPNHRRMFISFYLLHRSDDVSVYIVDAGGTIVRTLASGRHMRKGVRNPDGDFTWDGREDDGTVAPDGTYYIRVALQHQGRTVQLKNAAGQPVTVRIQTVAPRPVVTRVTPQLIPQGHTPVTIDFRGTQRRSAIVQIYRTDLPGMPLVKRFKTRWGSSSAKWDGLIGGRPAPQGTYLIGLRATNAACSAGRFPPQIPPAPGSTPHAGVSVRYLAAQPPATPTPAGSRATVYVDSRHVRYSWTLWRAGARKPSGHGAQLGYRLEVKLPPARAAGLYHLVLHAGADRADVPLAADHPGTRNRPHVLVVLPALSWQGENPVDDDGDGIPNTLEDGGPILLQRPYAAGLPSGYADEASLLTYLDHQHLPYDLTTDLALIQAVGPKLSQYPSVVLAGSERWIPPSLGSVLRGYVQNGGQVLSLGLDSLLRGVTLHGGTASAPTAPAAADIFGARPGPVTSTGGALITVIRDGLGIFSGTAGVLPGYRSFAPIRSVAPPAEILSAAGTSDTTESIVGFRLGRGFVVEIALPGFGASLARNVDAQELIGQLWARLRR
jgi:hypothetical protein